MGLAPFYGQSREERLIHRSRVSPPAPRRVRSKSSLLPLHYEMQRLATETTDTAINVNAPKQASRRGVKGLPLDPSPPPNYHLLCPQLGLVPQKSTEIKNTAEEQPLPRPEVVKVIIRLSPLRQSQINSPHFDLGKAQVVFYNPQKSQQLPCPEKPAALNTQIQIHADPGKPLPRVSPGRWQEERKSSRSPP